MVNEKGAFFKIEEYNLADSSTQQLFLLRIINNLVYKNKWYIVGCFVLGDIENKTKLTEMREKLVKYLKKQKTLKIKSVILQDLDGDDFVDIEEISL